MTKQPTVGVDLHDPEGAKFGKCLRCLIDVALYDEAYWDTTTMVHLDPCAINWNAKDATYTFKKAPLTIDDLVASVV